MAALQKLKECHCSIRSREEIAKLNNKGNCFPVSITVIWNHCLFCNQVVANCRQNRCDESQSKQFCEIKNMALKTWNRSYLSVQHNSSGLPPSRIQYLGIWSGISPNCALQQFEEMVHESQQCLWKCKCTKNKLKSPNVCGKFHIPSAWSFLKLEWNWVIWTFGKLSNQFKLNLLVWELLKLWTNHNAKLQSRYQDRFESQVLY